MSSPLPPTKLTTPTSITTFLSQYHTILFDCDGVLWSGSHLFPQIPETLSFLRNQGKRLIFVTNNSTVSRPAYKKKLAGLGIPAEEDEIFPSSFSTAVYLANVLKLERGTKVYVIGEEGIRRELEEVGLIVIGADDPSERREIQPEDYAGIPSTLDPEVKAVVTGLDRHLNYYKLSRAFHYLSQPGTHFIATNMDNVIPQQGKFFPGAGSCCAPLRIMSGREPVSLGKPSKAMMDAIESKVGFEKEGACMVGDRLDTDVKFGLDSGLGGTLAVLTGVATEEDITTGRYGVWTKYYIDSVADLLKAQEASKE